MEPKDLINFEKEVIEKYEEGNTYAPVHLSGSKSENLERTLIDLFSVINGRDWVFTTHRSHYHALLKSKNKKWLMKEIIEKGHSSHINSKKYRIFSSAIVGGIIPIALGKAISIKRKKGKEKVFCFVGDMASEMGQFWEAVKYSNYEDLPLYFIIEDNKMGCNTPTGKVWKKNVDFSKTFPKVLKIWYDRKYPHYGVGKWITLKNKLKTEGDYNAKK